MTQQTKSTTGSRKPPRTPQKRFHYWVTRDSDPDTGVVSSLVRVWLTRPARHTLGERGAFWIGQAIGDMYSEWTLAQCYAACGTAPDDDRQSIRVEGDQQWEPGMTDNRPKVTS